MKNICLFVFIALISSLKSGAQLPFYNEIQNFKKLDSAHFPPQNEILFVGSSSFRKWTDVQSYFPQYPIINRGFGGSTLPDVIRYANDIIFPYHPKQIVIYCGENDLAYSDAVNADSVLKSFQTLFFLIRSHLPGENIVFISIKPSPSRADLMTEMDEANYLIKQFILQQKNISFVDVYHLMLTSSGKPMPGIFLDDNLHMNARGYKIWQKAIEPYLFK